MIALPFPGETAVLVIPVTAAAILAALPGYRMPRPASTCSPVS
jgi:hypothetical protein